MKVVVAPDGFGGTLTSRQAGEAIAAGWREARPGDEVVVLPMSDGGEGLLDAVATPADRWLTREVAGPQGHPLEAGFLVRPDGSAVIESALACGLHLLPAERRTPMLATTYGVGQLLDAAREAGVRRVLLGLGGSATVDGGAGALAALGWRLRTEDGSGLKIGGDDLHRIAAIESGGSTGWSGVEVELLADVDTTLLDAAARFGPQKGATPEQVEQLTAALRRWAEVVERDLVPGSDLHTEPGTGAAGGLGYALVAALGAHIRPGSASVAELTGVADAVADADVVVTGEGRLDATTSEGKVVAHVAELARATGHQVLAVVGQRAPGGPALDDVEEASPGGPGPDPAGDVRRAAHRLAARHR